FFIGVAAGLVQHSRDRRGNRSMMVHPDRKTEIHRRYCQWVKTIRDTWEEELVLPVGDPSRVTLVESFRSAYNDIAATVEDMPPFEDLLVRLPRAVREVQLHEVN